MPRLRALCIFGVAACGGGSSATVDAPATHDAAIVVADSAPLVDAQPIDAAIVPPVDGAPAMGAKHHYVANKIAVPQNNSQAANEALDLNGDGVVDNQFGSILAAFSAQGFTTQDAFDTAISQGKVIILAELTSDSFTTQDAAGFTTYTGANPNPPACSGTSDTVCGHHLTGSASFTVAPPEDAPLVGNLVAGTLATTSPSGKLPLSLAIGTSTFTVELIGARAKVTGASAFGLTAIVAGGITQTDIDGKVYPAFATTMNQVIAQDCHALTSPPTCGCASGSSGNQVVQLFDTDMDCHVTATEIASNALIKSLFATDLTIDGQAALSVGMQLTAISATY